MSRIGKRQINIPNGVEVKFENGLMSVSGPKGKLERKFKKDIDINVAEKEITLKPAVENNFTKALWGTYGSHIANMIQGVTEGFEKKLEIEGTGYRAEVSGNKITLSLGYSHPVILDVPEGLSAEVTKNVVSISGIDKEKVGHFAALIRSKRKPEPYKGKGVRYMGEHIERKQGKKTAA